jgi:hypothetical protein
VAASHKDAKFTLTDCVVAHNKALGGIGDTGGPASNGGDAQGGGAHNVADATMTLTASAITHNRARGGKGKHGGADGEGVGGGLYNVGTLTVDPATVITGNHASTSHDDVYA